MKPVAEFGFVTGGHAASMPYAQASLASMRHYCPEVPIALLVDGDFDVSQLEKLYGVIPLRVDDLPSAEMKRLVARSYHAKHVPMWEGPFEYYVWIDADAIVWGDFTAQVRKDVDFHIFRGDKDEIVPPGAAEVPPWMPHFYFDPAKLKGFDPDFRWQGNPYFCPGVMAARRGAIPFEEYAKTARWAAENPGLFSWGDMGIINYLVHARAQRGQLKYAVSDLQDMWAHNGKEELVKDTAGTGWKFPRKIERPRVAHFCGRKPHIFDPHAYSRPFTIARLEHYRRVYGPVGAWWALLREEAGALSDKVAQRLRRAIKC